MDFAKLSFLFISTLIIGCTSDLRASGEASECKQATLWAQYKLPARENGKRILKTSEPKQLDLPLSKDGMLPSNLLIKYSSKAPKEVLLSRIESGEDSSSKQKKPNNVEFESSQEDKSLLVFSKLDASALVESMKLDEVVKFSLVYEDKTSCDITVSYGSGH